MRRGLQLKSARLCFLGSVVVFAMLAACGNKTSTPNASPATSASVSLDPDAPAFPVPTGSVLINAQMEGSGATAYRLVAWESGADYATTTHFYEALSDSRWRPTGSPAVTPQATDVGFFDSQSVFAEAELEITRTDPIRIEARFIPPAGAPATSFGPGPTIVFGQLPRATSLADGFPAAFVPPVTTLYDASSIGTTYFAIFSGTVDPAAYLAQIKAVAPDARSSLTLNVTAIDFTYDGQPGKAVGDAGAGQVSVEVTK